MTFDGYVLPPVCILGAGPTNFFTLLGQIYKWVLKHVNNVWTPVVCRTAVTKIRHLEMNEKQDYCNTYLFTINCNWIIFRSNSKSQVGHLSDFILFFNFGHIQTPLLFIVVIDFGHVPLVNVCQCDLFVHVQIFGLIHLVILNWSNEYSSLLTKWGGFVAVKLTIYALYFTPP